MKVVFSPVYNSKEELTNAVKEVSYNSSTKFETTFAFDILV